MRQASHQLDLRAWLKILQSTIFDDTHTEKSCFQRSPNQVKLVSRMKVSKEEKARNREKVIAAAAKLFRERGFDGISVADLMKKVGLTHGGFYGHFSSKEQLKALATQRAMQEVATQIEQIMDGAPDHPLTALLEWYLSDTHRANWTTGCVLSALGSELARQPEAVREVVTEEQQRLVQMIAKRIPRPDMATRRKHAIVFLAQMVGALTLSRAVSDPKRSKEILRASIELGILPEQQ